MAYILNPHLPYNGNLSGGRPGTLLQVNGFIPHHAQQFVINLKTGNNDIALHVNPRFHQNALVLNHFQYGNWGNEERASLGSLQKGRQFELKILIENDKFMLALNGAHHCHFHHRIAKEQIQRLEITGDAQIQLVNDTPSFGPTPIINPPVPYTTQLHGGCNHGKKVVVRGVGTGNGFSINLQQGYEPLKNAGLHFNIRFNERVIVINDSNHGNWGTEERHGLNFNIGQPFVVEITSHSHAYEIRLNGTHINFQHRNPYGRPLHSLDTLHITGNLIIHQVEISG